MEILACEGPKTPFKSVSTTLAINDAQQYGQKAAGITFNDERVAGSTENKSHEAQWRSLRILLERAHTRGWVENGKDKVYCF